MKKSLIETYEKDEQAQASILERLVSLSRSKSFAIFCGFVVVAMVWSFLGILAEKSGIITEPAWWMFYGFGVGKLSWYLGDLTLDLVRRGEGEGFNMEYFDKWIRLFLAILPHLCLINGSIFLIYNRVPGWGNFLFVTALVLCFTSINVD